MDLDGQPTHFFCLPPRSVFSSAAGPMSSFLPPPAFAKHLHMPCGQYLSGIFSMPMPQHPPFFLLDQSTRDTPTPIPSVRILKQLPFQKDLEAPCDCHLVCSEKELCIWGCWHQPAVRPCVLVSKAAPPGELQLAFTSARITPWSREVFLVLPQTWGHCAIPGM